jgi:putative ABC transport system substrate-binding protein
LASVATFAQQPVRVYRVGWLQTGPLGSDQEFVDDVKTTLRDLGYIAGKSVVIEFRSAEGDPEKLPGAAAALVALKPDLIVAGATPGTRAAKSATSTIPIVMIGVSDPVGAGFAASLSRPGSNVTGVANLGLDTAAKSIEMLHSIVPKVTRIAVLATANPAIPAMIAKIAEEAKKLGVTTLPITVSSLDDIEKAFVSMVKERAQALVVIADTVTMIHRKRIAQLAAEHKLPAIYQYAVQVEAGGLVSYGPNPRILPRLVAGYIDKILKGTKPGDLPIQQPTEFELAINKKTARALGITFPPEILLRADTVVE